jgi:hypothetical protein
MEWGTKASNTDLILEDALFASTLEYTVTEWKGRVAVVAGNLLKESGFEEAATGSWALSLLTAWKFEGLDVGLGNIWATGSNPNTHSGAAQFSDFGWRGGTPADRCFIPINGTLKILQDVAVSANGLAAGTKVTLSVWINRVNNDQSDFKLLVGAQEEPMTLTTGANYQQISHTFTLAAGDIVADKVTVGLSYKALAQLTSTRVDDFYFGAAEE